jgi:hypothetical protein
MSGDERSQHPAKIRLGERETREKTAKIKEVLSDILGYVPEREWDDLISLCHNLPDNVLDRRITQIRQRAVSAIVQQPVIPILAEVEKKP